MSTAAVTVNPSTATPASTENGFERFIDKLLPFLTESEELADVARPLLALSPLGPEYNVVLTGIEVATVAGVRLKAAGAALTDEQKMAIALSVATPQLTTILASKGVTTPPVVSTAIQQFAQNVYNMQTGPAAVVTPAAK